MEKTSLWGRLFHYLQDPYLVARFQQFCGVRGTFPTTAAEECNNSGNRADCGRKQALSNGACPHHSPGDNDGETAGVFEAGQDKTPQSISQGPHKRSQAVNESEKRGEDGEKLSQNGAAKPGGDTAGSAVKPLRKNSLTGDAGQEFIIENRFLFYLFTFGTELGNELFYITFFPFVMWNIDAFVGRRIIMVWAWVMYLGQCTKDLLGWSRPASPPVVKVEMFYNSEYSMPSTHAMSGTAIPFALFYMTYGRWEYPFAVGFSVALSWCVLVCVSRIYMGMHSLLCFPMEALEHRLSSLSVSGRSAPSEPVYLLDVSLAPPPGDAAVVSCSDFTLRLHDKQTLRLLRTNAGHRNPISAVKFTHRSTDTFYSASLDGTVRLWDVRRSGKDSAQVFRSDPTHHSFSGFDLSCDDSLLCAGTEQVNGEDSFLVFWDARKPGGDLLGVYSESHSDDITQVLFHPMDKDRLVSGSTDGLVNVFDLSKGAEEDALVGTCNSESSVSALCWLGRGQGRQGRLLCVSHDEGLKLWDLDSLETEDELTVYSTEDARTTAGNNKHGGSAVDYLIGGCWLDSEEQLLVVGGSGAGDVHLFTCDKPGLNPVRTLSAGHRATVRCFGFDPRSLSLFTGGEDGLLLRWSPDQTSGTSSGTSDQTSRTSSGTSDQTSGTSSGTSDQTSGTWSGTSDQTSGTSSGTSDQTSGTSSGTSDQTSGTSSGTSKTKSGAEGSEPDVGSSRKSQRKHESMKSESVMKLQSRPHKKHKFNREKKLT